MLIMKQVIIFLLAFYDAPTSRAHEIFKKLGHIWMQALIKQLVLSGANSDK